MLISLHVKNLALIEEEEVLFEDGLNILTGETGAGKSIIIGSVNLALGAKADKNLIRTGAEYALVELVFRIDNERQAEKLREMEIEPDEDGCILIKRRIYPGRSVCSAAGETVTTKQLREIASLMIDVYGQRENHRLLRKEAQLDVIDEYSGEEAAAAREKVRNDHRLWRKLKEEYEKDDLDNAARIREMDLIAYEIREIEEAQLKDGEDEELDAQYRRMSNFRKISEAVQIAQALMDGEEQGGSASSLIGRALRELLHVQGVDESLDAITAQLSDIDSLISEASGSLSSYMEDLSFDPQEMNRIESRLETIHHLKDKYGRTIPMIRQGLEERKERYVQLEDYDAVRAKLKKELQTVHDRLMDECSILSGIRRKAAKEFAQALKAALLDLNFNQVELEIEIDSDDSEPGTNGYDRASFLISMNPGEAMRPMDEIASGGELSRIMLGLKTVFAGKDDIYTFIFDEIDSGISGQTAWKVSEKLGQLARNHQILCITHLPQIAAMEDAHYEIAKVLKDGRTMTHIRRLTEDGSNEELARLLGAAQLTESALENAREMKQLAGRTKTAG